MQIAIFQNLHVRIDTVMVAGRDRSVLSTGAMVLVVSAGGACVVSVTIVAWEHRGDQRRSTCSSSELIDSLLHAFPY